MRYRVLLACLLVVFATTPSRALDSNLDALDDAVSSQPNGEWFGGGTVGIVDTGDGSTADFGNRLTGLGYAVELIPMDSGYSTFVNYDAVLLPVSHGSACCNATIAAHAADYYRYVTEGHCLYVAQPNPFNMPGGQSDIPWVPYHLRLEAFYDVSDCPPTIVDPTHCVTDGLQGSDLPFPGDTVLELGAEWDVLVAGSSTGRPSVLFAAYGGGNVLVELAHPSFGALCVYTDQALDQMVSCCLAVPPTPVQASTWGEIKGRYR